MVPELGRRAAPELVVGLFVDVDTSTKLSVVRIALLSATPEQGDALSAAVVSKGSA